MLEEIIACAVKKVKRENYYIVPTYTFLKFKCFYSNVLIFKKWLKIFFSYNVLRNLG